MSRWLGFLILFAVAAPSAAGAVELVQGWQMVSFPILESKPLADFDVIEKDTAERRTFAEACAPGSDCWLERQLWWYDPATQGYKRTGLGEEADENDVVPNRGYWVYSYAEHTLNLVPTYDITDYFPLELGSQRLMDALGNKYQGTYSVFYAVDEEANICGIPCQGRYVLEGPLEEGDPYYWWLEWWASGSTGLREVGAEFFLDELSVRLNPPLVRPNRMYAGEGHTQTVIVAEDCGGAGISVACSVRLLGSEVVNTIAGDLLSLKFEETYEWPDGALHRSLIWVAPGVGEVRCLDWSDFFLDSIEELVDWWP